MYETTIRPVKVRVDLSKGFRQQGYLVEYTMPERWPAECATITVRHDCDWAIETPNPSP